MNLVYNNKHWAQLHTENKSKANSLGKWQWKTWALHSQGIVCTEFLQNVFITTVIVAELHPRAKRARGRSSIAKEMW